MARTNTSDVDDILDTTLDTTALQAYIDAASDVVDDIAANNSNISSGRLERIEKFYAAHLATAQDPRASSLSGANRSVSYESGDSDRQSSYFEVANSLDPTGILMEKQKPTATLSVPDTKGLYD